MPGAIEKEIHLKTNKVAQVEAKSSSASLLDRMAGPLFVLPALLFFIPFTLLPTLGTLYFVLFKWSGTGLGTLEFVGLQNFIELFRDDVFWIAIRNNFSFGVYIVGGQLALGLVVAILLTEGRRFGGLFQVIYMIPLTLSYVVVAVLASILFSPTFNVMNEILAQMGLGFLSNPWLGDIETARLVIIIVSIWKGFGFAMLLFIARIKEIPEEIYDAALVDGAGLLERTRYITIPFLKRIFFVVMMLEVINAFRMFDVIFTLTEGGPNNVTQVMATYAYMSGFYYSRMGYGTAISAVLLVIAAAVTALQLKFLLGRSEVI